MNSFDVVFGELKKSGLAVDLKRKTNDGQLVDARENELASLGTKATIASTAGLLKKLTPAEKLEWAIETKNEANVLYQQKQFREAMGKYVEALAGSDFGDKDPSSCNKGNVDSLVVPVLCNLAACCIQVEEWGKAVSFADQAVLLRPHCCKAHLRKGVGLMHLGEHELALEAFAKASTQVTSSSDSEEIKAPGNEESEDTFGQLSEADRRRLPLLIAEAKRGLLLHKKQMKQRKEALAKAFAQNSRRSQESVPDAADCPAVIAPEQTVAVNTTGDNIVSESQSPQLMTFTELIAFFFQLLFDFVAGLFKRKRD